MTLVEVGRSLLGVRRRPRSPRTTSSNVTVVPGLAHTIDLRQSRTTAVSTVLTATVVAASLAGLYFGRFAQTESTRGIVAATGGFSRLDAPRDGVVTKIFVKQGQLVTQGQPIYALRLRTATANGQSAVESEIRNLSEARDAHRGEIERADAFVTKAAEQQTRLQAEQASFYHGLDEQLKATSEAVERSRASTRRLAAYVKSGYATRELLESHERSSFDYERQLSEIRLKRLEYKRQDAERQRDFDALIASRVSQKVASETQIATIESRLATLKTESALEVQAQGPGRVVALAARIGDSVKSGQFVAAVGDPTAEPLVVVEAPARAVGMAAVGQSVILKYDAFPYKTFGIQHGTITYISAAAVRAPATGDDKREPGLDPRPVALQSAYRIEIKPDKPTIEAYGETLPLKIGSTLSADIVIERRRLIDWVLDPIRALRGR